MKKTIAVTVLASIIGLAGLYQASAYMGMGGEGVPCGQPMGMAARSQMDETTKAKYKVFFTETQDQRKEIVVKRAEMKALMGAQNPDSQKVSTLAGELFDLKMKMRTKAEAAGLDASPGKGCGCGVNGRQGMMKGQKMMNNQAPAAQ